jgi:hypothetical protein
VIGMKTDFSKQLYDKYFRLNNRSMELVLKNGKHFKGFICGFFRGDPDRDDPYVIKWHMVTEADKKIFGTNILGLIAGEIIKQDDIAEVYFDCDQSCLTCTTTKNE